MELVGANWPKSGPKVRFRSDICRAETRMLAANVGWSDCGTGHPQDCASLSENTGTLTINPKNP